MSKTVMGSCRFMRKLALFGHKWWCRNISSPCTQCDWSQPVRWFGQPAAQTHPHLLQQGEVTPGITQEEYQQRRHNLMDKILRNTGTSQDTIVIIPSAAKVYMTHDIPYTFRQNTDFLYLCGFQEADSVLVVENSIATSSFSDSKSTLFVPKKDAHKELWEGPRSGTKGAVELTGVDAAYNMDELGNYLLSYLSEHRGFITWYDYRKPANVEFHVRYMTDFLKENNTGHLENPRTLIQASRVLKSPAERKLMQKTCDIASKAFREVMKYTYPGINESHLYAKMDFECRITGAEYLAYPPVVAGGNRANTIHYVANNCIVDDREMVLMDAGCECHGYSSDITRTWPVSGINIFMTGEFTSAQRALYEAVLEVQESCVYLCKIHDLTMDDMFHEMLRLIGEQLRRIGVVPHRYSQVELEAAAREFCPHHIGHYLGMDIHDTDEISRSIKLQPGMVVTVEPGIYIPQTRTDVPVEFRGMGIRIEDDILITEEGAHNLTMACPKDADEIEQIMQGKL